MGSASPWAVYDAWGADDIRDASEITKNEHLLNDDAVALPFSTAAFKGLDPTEENSDGGQPPVDDILAAFEAQMQARSNSHFGYPYNLMHNNEPLHKFMRYSINNLGDPFVASNYGVHSRQFELVCAISSDRQAKTVSIQVLQYMRLCFFSFLTLYCCKAVIDFFAKLWKAPKDKVTFRAYSCDCSLCIFNVPCC
jgi:hypothetical protein